MNRAKPLCLLAATLIPFNTASAAKPNVLFIVCDDLNSHVSAVGYPHIHTPAWDRLAAAGMTFRRAYCQYPVCGPSRASFLSGLYPESTGVIDNKSDIRQTRPGTVSMPQAFKQGGYWTAGTGKIFHNQATDPGELAWDAREWFSNDEMPIEADARKAFEAEHGPVSDRKNRKAWKEFLPTVAPQTRGQQPGYGRSGLTDAQHADGKNAIQAAAWIEGKSRGEKPFFIAVGIHKPHVPFLAPGVYFDLYPKEELVFTPPPKDFWNQVPKSAFYKRYEGFGFEREVENDALRREFIQAYHACVSFADAQIGHVLDSLEAAGHWDDTVIILTSDHGYQLGEHFLWGKVTLFEVCNRVPLVIRAPGVTQPGSASEGLVEMVDYFPTLAELCDITAPGELQGRSLVPMLKDPAAPGKESTYTVVARGKALGRAVRTLRWRYTKWPDGEELYDLENDLEEHHNLANSAENDEAMDAMRKYLATAEAEARARRQLPAKVQP